MFFCSPKTIDYLTVVAISVLSVKFANCNLQEAAHGNNFSAL
jgi:hypothetical protein